jgi:hypothetical protein
MAQSAYDFRQEDSFRKKAYAFPYSDDSRLMAILDQMRDMIPRLNTDGQRLNVRAAQIHEKDMRGSIYSALCGNKGLLAEGSNPEIVQAACQAYLDTILYAGI